MSVWITMYVYNCWFLQNELYICQVTCYLVWLLPVHCPGSPSPYTTTGHHWISQWSNTVHKPRSSQYYRMADFMQNIVHQNPIIQLVRLYWSLCTISQFNEIVKPKWTDYNIICKYTSQGIEKRLRWVECITQHNHLQISIQYMAMLCKKLDNVCNTQSKHY